MFFIPPKRYFIFAGVLVLMVGAGLWFYGWRQVRGIRESGRKEIAAYEESQRKILEAYENDTYGGATPEETLRLFVEALKKEDIELASKYFALDDNLSRGYAVEALVSVRNNNNLRIIASLLENATPYMKDRLYENDYKFVVYENGVLKSEINMEFNPVSKVWKIESL